MNSRKFAASAAMDFKRAVDAAKCEIEKVVDCSSDINKLRELKSIIDANDSKWSGGRFSEKNMLEFAVKEAALAMFDDLLKRIK